MNKYVNYLTFVGLFFFTGLMETIALICLQKEVVTGGFFLTSEVCANLVNEIFKLFGNC